MLTADAENNIEIEKSRNIMLIGPTGCGKTLMAKTLGDAGLAGAVRDRRCDDPHRGGAVTCAAKTSRNLLLKLLHTPPISTSKRPSAAFCSSKRSKR